MKKILSLSALVVLSSLSCTVQAADTGFYTALDVGQAKAKEACNNTKAGWSCKNTDTGYRVVGGYQISPRFAIEGSYADYGSAISSSALGVGKLSSSGFEVSGVGSYPVSESFFLTGKLGAAFTKVKSDALAMGYTPNSANSTTLAYGIGGLYQIDKTIALRAQYEAFGKVGNAATTGACNLTLLSLGVVVGF